MNNQKAIKRENRNITMNSIAFPLNILLCVSCIFALVTGNWKPNEFVIVIIYTALIPFYAKCAIDNIRIIIRSRKNKKALRCQAAQPVVAQPLPKDVVISWDITE